ncbi:HK97 gp10 family phage protein [Roseivivax isoporae]|uniref:HK97 family phage protein n=1 Tax=Roseivivax isoporae LMG 25204 TaxID=1449351 RepID=X7F1J5_9RHOB|nr:HK97 gp10 family phage protein [Roseivivax isoporae]ETX26603.1 hypothetical protein RISW2_21795 [Roseivivax isoporae LMG 25204]
MVQGLSQFRARWGSLPTRVRKAVIETLEQNAEELVQEMKANAPELSGELRKSIGWTWGDAPEGSMTLGRVRGDDEALVITIYAGNEKTMVTNSRGIRFQNAKLQEFGTKEMPANPYFFPVYRLRKRRIKSRLTRNVNKAIKAT